MNNENYLSQSLYLRGLPVYPSDLPFIHQVLYEMDQAGIALHAFPALNMETPITIVDQELML